MKSKFLTCFILLFIIASPNAESADDTSNNYDERLAKQLGADDYGMRSYVFVILNTGPNDAVITDKDKRKTIFSGHFSNMGRLAKEGKLVLAGPFIEGGNKRGMYIFNVAKIEEAKALVESDPAVVAGIFTADYTKYYGSAGLMNLNEIHDKIQKVKIE
ncbi:MAG: hypothetical protein COA86_00610 [Kangiella sp.]|nr:MAG: hypothetical protein COA86_00610 [Kangiella sp.]